MWRRAQYDPPTHTSVRARYPHKCCSCGNCTQCANADNAVPYPALAWKKLRPRCLFRRAASQCPAARCGNHLVAVERQAGKFAERAALPPVVFRSQRFRRILQHANTILISNCHYSNLWT